MGIVFLNKEIFENKKKFRERWCSPVKIVRERKNYRSVKTNENKNERFYLINEVFYLMNDFTKWSFSENTNKIDGKYTVLFWKNEINFC